MGISREVSSGRGMISIEGMIRAGARARVRFEDKVQVFWLGLGSACEPSDPNLNLRDPNLNATYLVLSL